jgi:hypothetical protein
MEDLETRLSEALSRVRGLLLGAAQVYVMRPNESISICIREPPFHHPRRGYRIRRGAWGGTENVGRHV